MSTPRVRDESPLEAWLENAKYIYTKDNDIKICIALGEAIAVIEKLKEALKNQAQFADMLGHTDGSDYANYAGHIYLESSTALSIDPEKL